jgi:hypothetical protein
MDSLNGMMWHLGRDHALYAEALRRRGDVSGARESLRKSREILRGCGAEAWLKSVEARF